jgi:hypothetical protein
MHKSLWYAGIAFALSLNYASAFVIIIAWNIHILYSLPLIFTISFIVGALIADIRVSIIYAIICMTAGVAVAAAVISAPPIVYSGSYAEINTIFALAMNSIAKIFTVNITTFFAGAIIGHLLSEVTETASPPSS